jgi:hypothetical protein
MEVFFCPFFQTGMSVRLVICGRSFTGLFFFRDKFFFSETDGAEDGRVLMHHVSLKAA